MKDNKRILVVDDDIGLQEAYHKILTPATRDKIIHEGEDLFGQLSCETKLKSPIHYDLNITSSGEAGIQAVKESIALDRPFAVVFLDIVMPGMDGVETAQKLWELDSRLKIVIVTAYGNQYNPENIITLTGREDIFFLRKPFTHEEISQFARALTKQWSLERHQEKLAAELYKINQALANEIMVRSQQEGLLQKNETYLRAILENIVDGIITVDEHGLVISFNPAAEKIFGYRAQEIIGQNVKKLMPPPYQGEHDDYIQSYLDSGVPKVIGIGREVTGVRKDGTNFLLYLAINEMRLPQQRQFVGILRDLSAIKQAEITIKRLAAIVEFTGDAVISLDLQGVVVSWNHAAENIYQYSNQEAIGNYIGDLIAPNQLREISEILAKLYRGEKLDHYETVRQRKDGKLVNVSLTISTIRDFAGNIVGISEIARDITEKAQIERSLQQITSLQKAILNSTNYTIISTNIDGIIQSTNKAVENCLGYCSEELVNKANITIMHDPEEIKLRAQELTRELGLPVTPDFAVFTAKASQGLPDEREWIYIHKNNSRFPVLLSVTALRDSNNKLHGYLMIGNDITERQKTEEKLRKLSQAVEQSPATVVITDTHGIIEYVNSNFTKISGYTAEEALGKSVRLFEEVENKADGKYQQILKAIKSGKDWRGTFHNKRKNGELYWESASISAVKNNHGNITHFIALKEDITAFKEVQDELKKAKEEAIAANMAKSEFLAAMSHEIRTPMNAIIGMAELLSETDLNEEQQKYVRVFRLAGESLLKIINDILDYSKVEANQIVIEKVDFDLVELVKNIVATLSIEACAKGLEFKCKIDENLPSRLIGDSVRLGQIITNLLGNAIKFTEQGEVALEITIGPAYSASECRVKFMVKDTGIGIPARKINSIFETFTQADSSITRKYGGSGLGLTISKRLVELMQGEIFVASKINQGSVFTFEIPFQFRHELGKKDLCSLIEGLSQSKEAAEVQYLIVEEKPLHILLVDDLSDNRLLLKVYLKNTPYFIEEAENGQIAVNKIMTKQYDLILMDMQMPVMDGFTATKIIRDWEEKTHRLATPIIALTASAMREDIEKSLTAGCNAHLSKPIKKSILLKIINKYS